MATLEGPWLDVTVPIRDGMAVFPGDPPCEVRRVQSLAEGGGSNLSRISASCHAGTHIDAPVHFIDGGESVEQTPLEALVGRAWVVEARTIDGHIDVETLEQLEIPPDAERLLFKTPNSELWALDGFSEEYVALTEEAATELVSRGVRLVGVDYLSVAPFADPAPVHTALLGAGVVVLEGLDLRGIEPGPYELLCLPLLIEGADGAPARVLLGEVEDVSG